MSKKMRYNGNRKIQLILKNARKEGKRECADVTNRNKISINIYIKCTLFNLKRQILSERIIKKLNYMQ